MEGKTITKTVQVPQEKTVGVTMTFTVDEAKKISDRLHCSSFKTYDQYRKENNIPHYTRASFAEAFDKAAGINS